MVMWLGFGWWLWWGVYGLSCWLHFVILTESSFRDFFILVSVQIFFPLLSFKKVPWKVLNVFACTSSRMQMMIPNCFDISKLRPARIPLLSLPNYRIDRPIFKIGRWVDFREADPSKPDHFWTLRWRNRSRIVPDYFHTLQSLSPSRIIGAY